MRPGLKLMRTFAFVIFALVILVGGPHAVAQELPGITINQAADGSQEWSLKLQTLLFLTSLTFLPAAILMMTCFTRIIIVLGLLRTALGTTTTPPNQVLLGLTLFLTFFIMSPVIDEIYKTAWAPLSQDEIQFEEAIERGKQPIRSFMLAQTRRDDIALFAQIAKLEALESPADIPFSVLVPAFVTSELKTAFQIGFTIFIPFLIIDLVVASILMSLGMMMVPPVTISLPFKLMLLVLIDGWQLLVGSLTQSFVIV